MSAAGGRASEPVGGSLTLAEPRGAGSDAGASLRLGTVDGIDGQIASVVALFPADDLKSLHAATAGHGALGRELERGGYTSTQ